MSVASRLSDTLKSAGSIDKLPTPTDHSTEYSSAAASVWLNPTPQHLLSQTSQPALTFVVHTLSEQLYDRPNHADVDWAGLESPSRSFVSLPRRSLKDALL